MPEIAYWVTTIVAVVHLAATAILIAAGCIQHFSEDFRIWLVGAPVASIALLDKEP